MCRWIAYRGETVPLEQYVTQPARSLLAQSLDAFESLASVNGDGFGRHGNAFFALGDFELAIGTDDVAAVDDDVFNLKFGHAGSGDGDRVFAGLEAEHFVVALTIGGGGADGTSGGVGDNDRGAWDDGSGGVGDDAADGAEVGALTRGVACSEQH